MSKVVKRAAGIVGMIAGIAAVALTGGIALGVLSAGATIFGIGAAGFSAISASLSPAARRLAVRIERPSNGAPTTKGAA